MTVAALWPAPASATHIVVRADSTGDVPTFQAGVECVLGIRCDPPPDTLLVGAGVYAEDVAFDMSGWGNGAIVCPSGPDLTRVRSISSGGGYSARCSIQGLGVDGAVNCSDSGSMLHWQGCRFLGDARSHGYVGSQQFSDCDFRARLDVAGAGTIERCSFVGARAALHLTIFGLTVRDCLFESCADTALFATPGDNALIELQRCTFRSVGRAIVVNPDPNYYRDGLRVMECRFEDVANEAIAYDSRSTWSLNWLEFEITRSRFTRCGAGVRVAGNQSRVDVTMVADTLEDTQGTALDAAARLNWKLDSLVVHRGHAGAIALHERNTMPPQVRSLTRSVIEDNAGDALTVEADPESAFARRRIEGNWIARNGGAGVAVGDGSIVSGNVVVGNAGSGLSLTSSLATADSVVLNTLVGNGGSGIVVQGPGSGMAPVVFVENNLSVENAALGIGIQGQVAGTARGNDAWRNHAGDLQGASAAVNLNADPLFCGAAGADYHVAGNSPCAPGGPDGPIGALGVGCDSLPVAAVPPSSEGALAIGRVSPNPLIGQGDVTIFFTLPTPQSATMDVLDAGGRRVASHDLATAGAGDHRLQLRIGDLPPGVYWLRVAQGGQSAASKVCVLP
ncbi:MAG: T9SS type A sorting domain-containing protein [Candidatus Eisenbacteria bacterium]|uniref:T9SS type A sorting domain-containing protein n=1 Tax=Eiseniibacteriota bacterium TaxID=2212470 RepID=A0A538U8W8_UNCEI|nr:MAG: T9SS type A sorting domain-containing protein [Candidatus Eisenbacteria bacterium]